MVIGPLTLILATATAPDSTRSSTGGYPEFRVPKDGSGWVDFETLEGGQIVIPVLVNGAPVRALVDTGYDQLVISKSFADTHHLSYTPLANPIGFGGPSQLYGTSNISLTIGHIVTTKPGMFAVSDLGIVTQAASATFDAVIGLPLLATVEWEVDQDRHRVRFLPSGTLPTDGGVAVHVGPGNSRLLTTVEVDGRSVAPTMIDMGSDQAIMLTPIAAATVGFRPATDMMSAGVGGLVLQPMGDVRSITIGSRTLATAPAVVDDLKWASPVPINAMIGMDYLRHYDLLIDVPAGRMKLSSRMTSPQSRAKSTSGVQSLYVAGRLNIIHVMKNSPGAAAGLKSGDEICALNGAPMSRELWSGGWGRAAPGTRYTLTLCDGTSKAITLRAFY